MSEMVPRTTLIDQEFLRNSMDLNESSKKDSKCQGTFRYNTEPSYLTPKPALMSLSLSEKQDMDLND